MLLSRQFLLPRIIISLLLATLTWWFWPGDSALWRKIIAIILSVALGFQIAAALSSRGVAAAKAWLECGAFLCVMAAFLHLPDFSGWVLLVIGWSWRLLVRNLWR